MFFLFDQRTQPYQRPVMGRSFLLLGLLCTFFGLAILAAPELLAYLVASFFLVVGITLLSIWWQLRRIR